MDHEDAAIDALLKYASRLTRAIGYAVVAWLLLRNNLFGTPFTWSIPLALGVLGIASSSARIAQLGLLLLLVMALIPLQSFIPR
jgi:hypothetical protein